jgi:hypothetical protein
MKQLPAAVNTRRYVLTNMAAYFQPDVALESFGRAAVVLCLPADLSMDEETFIDQPQNRPGRPRTFRNISDNL